MKPVIRFVLIILTAFLFAVIVGHVFPYPSGIIIGGLGSIIIDDIL